MLLTKTHHRRQGPPLTQAPDAPHLRSSVAAVQDSMTPPTANLLDAPASTLSAAANHPADIRPSGGRQSPPSSISTPLHRDAGRQARSRKKVKRETSRGEEETKSQIGREQSNMSKRLCIESHGDQPQRIQGGHSVRDVSAISKRPLLGRCSGAEYDTSRLVRCTAARPVEQRQQQHLYLVVDDWARGYSVHRLDEDDFVSDPDLDARPAVSPLFRIEAQHPHPWSIAAHGTKVLAMQPSKSSPGIPVFDTATLAVTTCPFPRSRGDCGLKPIHVSAGGRLLAFAYLFVDVLGPEPPPTDESWSWTAAEEPAPFVSMLVSSYAVHPDGRTVFMSVERWRPDICGSIREFHIRTRNSTFAFDMESLEWTHVGEWLLPFKGQAYYDRELDAWVGLCLHKEGAGRVCCCDVLPVPAATGAGSETAMPAWKLGRDVLFDAGSDVHLGATLVYRGDSRFRLVQSQAHPNSDRHKRIRVLKTTAFGLKYDKDGNLRTTHRRAYASISYQIAHDRVGPVQNPVAFWM